MGTYSISVTLAGESKSVEITSDERSVGARVIMSVDTAPRDLAQAAFSTLSEDDALRAAMPGGFRIAGSESVLEITLQDSQGNRITELEEAGTVCLPVDEELLSDAGEQALKLLHYDVETGWVELYGSEVVSEDDVMLVCADTMRFSPFAVGYAKQATAAVIATATAIAEPSAMSTPMPPPISLKTTPVPPTAAPGKQAVPAVPETAPTAESAVMPMQQQQHSAPEPPSASEPPSAPGASDGATVVSEETSGSRVWLIAMLAVVMLAIVGALAVAGAVAYPRLRRR